jgi:hypothetical protein
MTPLEGVERFLELSLRLRRRKASRRRIASAP